MRKILIDIIERYFDGIISDWTSKLENEFDRKISRGKLKDLLEDVLRKIVSILKASEKNADEKIIELMYNRFEGCGFNIWEVSQVFSQGKFILITFIEKREFEYDPIIIIGFLNEGMENIFSLIVMKYQKSLENKFSKDKRKLLKKLTLNQKYLETLLYGSDAAIMIIDENEKFIAWNKGAEAIFGFKENEIIGKPSSFLLPTKEEFSRELERIIATVEKKGSLKIHETERRTKDERVIPVTLTVTRLEDENGKYIGRSVIIKDVTEVKTLQRQVDQSEKLAVIGQLAAGVAHEIGNPLTAISSVVQLLQRKADEEYFIDQLAVIKENIDRISRIVRELVDFSRPPSYEETAVEVTGIIKTAMGIVKYDRRVKNVDFVAEISENLPKVNIVPDQLLQVFVNILINSLDAIEGTGIIRVRTYYEKGKVKTEIEDNGCGMDKRIINKIFDPFFTTKQVGKGTGLGLSVSYGIVKKFGGEIKVESIPGQFSRFTVDLPTAK
ncbi:MAG: PAS domain S-box protein [Chlorobi bacterium]|nr:PAS domain S-box protein [Chlorobiota bacterium]